MKNTDGAFVSAKTPASFVEAVNPCIKVYALVVENETTGLVFDQPPVDHVALLNKQNIWNKYKIQPMDRTALMDA